MSHCGQGVHPVPVQVPPGLCFLPWVKKFVWIRLVRSAERRVAGCGVVVAALYFSCKRLVGRVVGEAAKPECLCNAVCS